MKLLNDRRFKYALGIVAVALLVFSAYQYGYSQGQKTAYEIYLPEEGKWVGSLEVVITRAKTGEVIRYVNHNLIVTIGKTWLKDFLKDGTAGATNATKYMSVSNDATPLASWTVLPGEVNANGFSRATGTVTTINATAYNCTYTWTATGTQQLQCGGIHHSPTALSDNNLHAAATFTQTTFNTDDTLKLTWTLNHT